MQFHLTTLDEYSDEALLSELRRVASLLGEKRLTVKSFDSLSRTSASTMQRRFGTWTAALDKAEISNEVAPRVKQVERSDVVGAIREFAEANPGQPLAENEIATRLGLHRGTITRKFGRWDDLLITMGLQPLIRRYTDEECFENILVLWTHYGRQPTFGELARKPSTVGPKPYASRWGGWRAALAAFVRRINQPDAAQEAPPDRAHSERSTELVVPTAPPRSISISLRYKILSRDKFRCVACGASPAKDGRVDLHIDHIIPWSLGGQNTEANLRTLCSMCNLGKGATL